jgi:hypothetical protein
MGGRRDRGDRGGGAERRARGGRGAGGGHEGRPNAGGQRGGGAAEDEEGYRQRVNERFDRLASRVERLEEEVRQLRGGGDGGGSQGA